MLVETYGALTPHEVKPMAALPIAPQVGPRGAWVAPPSKLGVWSWESPAEP